MEGSKSIGPWMKGVLVTVFLFFFMGKVETKSLILDATTKHPTPLTVFVDEKNTFYFNISLNVKPGGKSKILATVRDEHLANVKTTDIMMGQMGENETISVVMEGRLPGRTVLVLQAYSDNMTSESNTLRYTVYVERKQRIVDKAFTGVVISLVVLANIGMGCKVDLDIVKATLKKPVAPAIGLCSQFLFMPLIGFTMAYCLPLTPGTALGFFALGCSPGGSASNVYTNFLKGNVSLSVTMTLISSLAALAFIPLWLFTLGQHIYSQGNIRIPFENIITSLIGIIVPIVVGLVLQRKFPKAAKVFIQAVKYIMAIFFIFVFTVGVYANLFIFYLINSEVVLASALLPYLGFIFGGLFAFLTRQKIEDVVAIALETGIQNTGIPIILCRLSLTGPDKDTSIVSPVLSAIFTPIPVLFAILFVQGREWRKRRQERIREREEVLDDTLANSNGQTDDTTDFGGTKKRLMENGDRDEEG